MDDKELCYERLNAVPDWIWEIDLDCKFTYSNKAVADLLGYRAEEIIGLTLFDLMEHDEAERAAAVFKPIAEKRESLGLLRNTMLRKTGEEVIVEISASPVFDSEGGFCGYRGVGRDITQRVMYENQLEARTEELEAILHAFPDLYFWIDSERKILNYHAACPELLFIEPCCFIGKRFSEVISSEVGEQLDELIRKVIETKSPLSLEYQLPISGVQYFFEARMVLLEEDKVLAIIRDITQRKQAESALAEVQGKYRSLVEESLVGVYVIQDNDFVYVNPCFAEIFGYTQEELVGHNKMIDTIAFDDRKAVLDKLDRRLLGEMKSAHYQFKGIRKDGREINVEVYGSQTTYQGKPAVIGSLMDVTDRLKAESELQHKILLEEVITTLSTEFINLLPEEIDKGIRRAMGVLGEYIRADRSYLFLIDDDGRIARNTYEWYAPWILQDVDEYREQDILDLDNYPVFKENLRKREYVYVAFTEDLPDEQRRLRDMLRSSSVKSAIFLPMVSRGKPIGFLSFETIHQKGKWSEDNIMPLRVMGAVLVNVLDRKETEEALRNSEERYRLLFERSPNIVMVLKNNTIIDINSMVKTMLGFDEDEVIGLCPWDLSPEIQPDGMLSREKFSMLIEQTQKSGTKLFDWLCMGKDGSNIDCDVSLSSYSIDGEPVIQAIIRDITERKRAEEHRRVFEKQIEEQKRSFYKDTILSVTEGKLGISDFSEVRKYLSEAEFQITAKDTSEVASARRGVKEYCRKQGLSGDRLDAFMVGVGEAITNAIKHAQKGRIYAGAADGELWVAIRDRGTGMSSLILPRATLLRGFSTKPSMGLGYSIMLEVSDQILLKTDMRGTIVVLKKNIEEPDILITAERLPDTWINIPG